MGRGRGRGGGKRTASSGAGKKHATKASSGSTPRKCRACGRALLECNAHPCPAKQKAPPQADRKEEEEEVPSPDDNRFAALSLRDDASEALIKADAESENPFREQQHFERENQRRIDYIIKKGIFVGKVHTATVLDHSPAGFVVDVEVEDPDSTDANAPSTTSSEAQDLSNDEAPNGETKKNVIVIRGVVKWHRPSIGCWPSIDERVQAASKRVPVGSRFGVYSGGVCAYTGDIRLRAATKPCPVLNTSRLQLNKQKEQPFRYLVVMDLEATCDYDPEPLVDASVNSEIIEFPWVVLDTETLEVIHEERYYVKPDFMAGLTPYCSALTGITRDQVAHSMNLENVLAKFEDYVDQRFADAHLGFESRSFRILTDGMWDVHVQLSMEARRKGIALPWWFREYFDLKLEFDKYFPFFITNKYGHPLHIMLRALGLPFVGRHHSGLDDCKSIVQIVQCLIKLGHVFSDPTRIEEDFDPLEGSWNKFDNKPSGDAWQCPACKLWNKPYARHQCAFCKAPK